MFNLKKGLFIAMAVLLCWTAQALSECVPTDDACAPKKKLEEWDKSLLFGLNLTNGNSETTLVNIGGNAHLERNNSVFDTALQYGYGEDKTNKVEGEDTTTRNDLKGSIQYDYLLTERFFTGFGTKILYDEIADIDYRTNLNPTIGYYLLKDNSFKFRVEGGPSYVFEKVGGEKDDYFAPRVAEAFEWAITCTSKLYEKAEIYFDPSDTNNYIVEAEAGIEAAISTNLSLVLKVQENYDNTPAVDKEKSDVSVISAIKVAL